MEELLKDYLAKQDHTRVDDSYFEPSDRMTAGELIYNIGSLIPGYRSLYGLLNEDEYGLYDALLDLQDDVVPGAIQYRDWYENGNIPGADDVGLAMFAAVPTPGAKRVSKMVNQKSKEALTHGKISKGQNPQRFNADNFTRNKNFEKVKEAVDDRLAQIQLHDIDGVPISELGAEDAFDASFLRHKGSNYNRIKNWMREDLQKIKDENVWGLKYHTVDDGYGGQKRIYLLKDDEGKWHDIYDEDFRAGVFDIFDQASPGYKNAAAKSVGRIRDLISEAPQKVDIPEGKKVIRAVFDPSKLKK